ncbi:DUF192 domain-containing protein [Ideonella sp. B7]|uniref:DUF192 domain-containing protein n=1 Tax=Ideonella benzenivorans TaxID=2831643 RepID=UPI001CED6984|nr:DUF192 domain-containing protein [Ideonella benzenivorans]MCA6218310.1 DUF192 domain-containing protein [Ideonella benzenivorans]
MSARIQLCIDGRPTQRVVRREGAVRRWLWPWAAPRQQGGGVLCGSWLRPCHWVHTWGARGAVDVVFLRADGVVLKVVPRLPPWRVARCQEAASVLRLRPGLARRVGLQPGSSLDLMA